jgi:hypothetical protein
MVSKLKQLLRQSSGLISKKQLAVLASSLPFEGKNIENSLDTFSTIEGDFWSKKQSLLSNKYDLGFVVPYGAIRGPALARTLKSYDFKPVKTSDNIFMYASQGILLDGNSSAASIVYKVNVPRSELLIAQGQLQDVVDSLKQYEEEYRNDF